MRVFGSEGYVRTVEGPDDPVYQVEEEHRRALSFYKNTILNLVAGRTIVSAAMLAAEPTSTLALAREKGATVCFVPQVTHEQGGDDDRAAARAVYDGVAAKERVRLVEEELSPDQIKALCGSMDFFVGTRMHSNILALTMGVPTLAIAYQPKTIGIMRQLGLERYVCGIEDLTLPAIQRRFEELAQNRQRIAAALRERLPIVRRLAVMNGELIEADFRNL